MMSMQLQSSAYTVVVEFLLDGWQETAPGSPNIRSLQSSKIMYVHMGPLCFSHLVAVPCVTFVKPQFIIPKLLFN